MNLILIVYSQFIIHFNISKTKFSSALKHHLREEITNYEAEVDSHWSNFINSTFILNVVDWLVNLGIHVMQTRQKLT